MRIGPDKVVIIFGLAGVGKSTLAQKLGSALGLRVIHPSGIMRDLMEGKQTSLNETRSNDGFWETEQGAKLLADRLEQAEPIDVAVNDILLQEVSKGQVVIDSWTLPWLTDIGLKIRLRASLETRIERAALRSTDSVERLRDKISKKDLDTRELFRRLYDFDIMTDHEVFHHTIDTEGLQATDVLEKTLEFCETWSKI